MSPHRESNQGLFGAWDHTHPTQPQQSGRIGDMLVDWCAWVKGGGGWRGACHKLIFGCLTKYLWGGERKGGVGGPTENGGDSGSEIGIENTRQAPGSP